jgi:hypothetical protein
MTAVRCYCEDGSKIFTSRAAASNELLSETETNARICGPVILFTPMFDAVAPDDPAAPPSPIAPRI